VTTKRRGRSRTKKIKRKIKKSVTKRARQAARYIADAPGRVLREATRSRVQARVSRDAWTPPRTTAPTAEVEWRHRHIEADKEIYEANFDGLAVEFDMWPSDSTDLETAAREAAELQHGPVAATWLLYSIHAVNAAAKAILPYPI
jgi:hypothetical protein